MENEILITGDGSHSLRSHQFAVPYHSTHGAINESRHVFIEMGVRPALRAGEKEISILEIGFGTGLNALLVWQMAAAHPDVQFNYRTIERYPISAASAGALNYPELLEVAPADFLALHEAAWDEPVAISPNFSLFKINGDFFATLTDHSASWANVIFYDAFAPASQPELWEPEILSRCARVLQHNGTLVTYCAKGQFKRNLKQVGLRVEPLPGPPGKREMTRARKL